MTRPLIEARDVSLAFGARRGLFPRDGFKALKGASAEAHRGETIGIVGESGSGKSTLGRCFLRLYKPDAGAVIFDGEDITRTSQAALRPLRRRMQMIFQDPLSSLNPRKTVARLIAEPARLHRPDLDAGARALALLDDVGLGAELAQRYPHQLSGGQRQRVGIAR
ncbi:MAG: dipeptide/oligopeptide/nickel ABC transporter ATP-binding protein, partial [Pseudomonadota bacterium]